MTSSAWAANLPEIDIPLKSSAAGIAEVYYDTGSGFSRFEKVAERVMPSKALEVLAFKLPTGTRIRALRFDPLNQPGTFEVGTITVKAPGGRVMAKIGPSDIQVRQQLNLISRGKQSITAVAPSGFTDPSFILKLAEPLDFGSPGGRARQSRTEATKYGWNPWIDELLIVVSIGTIISAFVTLNGRQLWRGGDKASSPRSPPSLNAKTEESPQIQTAVGADFVKPPASSGAIAWLDRLAEGISDSELIIFNRQSVFILLFTLAIFCIFCASGLHGSSTSLWDYHIAGEAPHHGLLLGQPKQIRSDELSVFTPDIFSQIYSKPAFSPVNRTIGGQKSVLFWFQPVNHFIEIPRFFLWPFHVLGVSAAYSIYWNLKGLTLFLGSYLLLLLLTGSRPWLSGAGALWIYFSGYTQWWFSHCLPEDIGFAALTLVGALYLVFARKRGLIYSGAIVLTISLLNFALIFYPAFGMPLVWVMLAIGAGFVIEKRRLLLAADPFRIRWILLLLALLICGMVLVAFTVDTRQTLKMILNTVYPGRRFSTGGSGSLLIFFTSFLDFIFTEGHVPKFISNICEGANFYLVGLLAIPVIFFPRAGRLRASAIDVLLACSALGMVIFVVFGFPHWLAGLSLLSKTTTGRVRVGIGIASVLLLMRHFARTSPGKGVEAVDWQVAIPTLALLCAGFVVFQSVSDFALPTLAVVMLLAVNGALVLFALGGQGGRFFVVMLTVLFTHNFLINPVAKGFSAITSKSLYKEARRIHAHDPDGKWVVFGSFQIANFLKFSGVDVINGNKFYPVFDYNNALDPDHAFINVWNRYAHIGCTDDPARLEAEYDLIRGIVYRIRVAARAPALAKIDVRYIVLTSPPSMADRPALIKQVRDGEKSYWILRRESLPVSQ